MCENKPTKETYIYEMRPKDTTYMHLIHINRDLQKRPTYMKRDLRIKETNKSEMRLQDTMYLDLVPNSDGNDTGIRCEKYL